MPAAIDSTRYRIVAWMAVGSRLAGVIFFVACSRPSTGCSATSIWCSSSRRSLLLLAIVGAPDPRRAHSVCGEHAGEERMTLF